jgi:4-deoxy-L-threo-5-hexosulose-uronate ketol-isomerase
MRIKVLQATHPDMIRSLDTQQLRELYMATDLFVPDDISLAYSHVERFIVGGVLPVKGPVKLATAKEVGSDPFLARRELGIVNIGGPGRVTVDGTAFNLAARDGLYVGMGASDVSFESREAGSPARYYLASSPSHAQHPVKHISMESAKPMHMGAPETSNERTIYQYIHPDICRSSQLLLGLTSLRKGNVWNTMPCHLHDRRSEIYFYFDLGANDRVFHFMGQPQETRHFVVSNEQAVVSPPWSIHTGAGTASYSFIWAMAGDNQDYKDMDAVPMATLR